MKEWLRAENPVELMTAFIDDRARSGRYSEHLSLISMIRQGFESMTNRLSEANKKDASASAEKLPKSRSALRRHSFELELPDVKWYIKNIPRIYG